MNAYINNCRFLAPEVVQTSAMDCGPASLKCLLEGFGVSISYGRLREACQTDVDGTSIDTMEEVAAQLGLNAEQVMVPADHLTLPESESLPAIVIVRLANGLTHFVVVWRIHGRFVQVMDPGTGRRWMSREQLISELYIHTATIPASAWREWVESDSFLNSLRRRLRELGLSKGEIEGSIKSALADESRRSMAALDAATRMTAAIAQAGGLSRGLLRDKTAARLLKQFAERGAVLVQVHGRRAKNDEREVKQALSPELVAALEEEPSRPGRDLIRLLRQDGSLAPLALIMALALAAGGLMIESILFQGLFDLSRKLAPAEQRLGAMAALIAFASALLLLDLTFRYRERGEPALRGCALRIRAGDRLLLEGESGGGKSTLASLLTGLREPESGLLLLGGLDRQTMGAAGWRKRVASAPQFHENHVLTGTFAFNLLMGRSWPPSEKDMAEAEEVCRALGLGDLLGRMPAGLLQMVGETGWQLSHGERSRMFMARALLQRADLVIMDESFGALDPATLRRCLQTALDRANTLMVIAHP